jgi:surface polysaccharide O-acyltransferase-like enzyme
MLFAWLIVDVLILIFFSMSFDIVLSSLLAASLLFLLWFLYAYFVYDVARSILDTSMVEGWKMALVVVLCIVNMVLAVRDPSSILGVIIDSLILFGAVGILFERTQDWE